MGGTLLFSNDLKVAERIRDTFCFRIPMSTTHSLQILVPIYKYPHLFTNKFEKTNCNKYKTIANTSSDFSQNLASLFKIK